MRLSSSLRLARIALHIVLLLGALPARGERPDSKTDAIQFARVGEQGPWSTTLITDANTTTLPVRVTAYLSPWYAACFTHGTAIDVFSTTEATCCWTNTSSVTLGDQTTSLANYITDTKNGGTTSGFGACHRLAANDRYTFLTSYIGMSSASSPTRRTGYCSLPSQNRNDRNAYSVWPCLADADCTTTRINSTSNGTCTAITTAQQYNCAALVCKAVTAGRITVTVTR